MKLISGKAVPGNNFIFFTVLFPRTGASRLIQECILNISVQQHISSMINIFSTGIKPCEILVNYQYEGTQSKLKGHKFIYISSK
jgi:hypothetical protein